MKFKGEQDTAEIGAETDADIFLFDANKMICFCFREFPTFT